MACFGGGGVPAAGLVSSGGSIWVASRLKRSSENGRLSPTLRIADRDHMPGTPHTRGRIPDWALHGLDIEGPADSNLNRALVKRGPRPATTNSAPVAPETEVVDASVGAMERLRGDLRHDQREDVLLVIARAQMENDQRIAELSHRTTVRVALLTFLGTVLAGAVGAAATIWASGGAGP